MQKFFFLFAILLITKFNSAQTIPVGQVGTDEMLRILQISGKIEPTQSFTARPFFYNKNIKYNDLLQLTDSSFDYRKVQKSFLNNQIQLSILSATIATKFNSDHPYGWNDGPMIMAKGLQTSIAGGIYAQMGPLSIQVQPEYIYAQNASYATNVSYGFNSGKSFSKLYPGQSSIRLNSGSLSIGASSENLWWGPGQFSSLLMSNNAPGFNHLTFNTVKPVKTIIGSFEWQLIFGILNEDTSAANEAAFMRQNLKKKESRYFNGIVLTYQPKWFKGLFIGFTRMLQFFSKDLNNRPGSVFKKYLPVLVSSSAAENFASNASNPDDGAISFFSRLILSKYNAEFYLEYGYNDYKGNWRDFSLNANHASAYIIGFKKLINLSSNKLLDISGELTQMAQSNSYLVRNAGNWYQVASNVYQGYTYQNQIMGAGSGVGNNLQTFQIKKITGFNQIGIKLQHIQQDPKGFSEGNAPNRIGLRTTPWNDWALGFVGQKRWDKIVLNSEIQFVQSKNYGWENGNRFNLFVTIGGIYFFN